MKAKHTIHVCENTSFENLVQVLFCKIDVIILTLYTHTSDSKYITMYHGYDLIEFLFD